MTSDFEGLSCMSFSRNQVAMVVVQSSRDVMSLLDEFGFNLMYNVVSSASL